MEEEAQFELLTKLRRDLKAASADLRPDEVRFLVDFYYQMQADRIRTGSQVKQSSESGEPNALLQFFADNTKALENNIKAAMSTYVQSNPVGRWSVDQKGIGPVIAAGLLAHIDISKANTAGKIWRFAGLDPTQEWYSAQKSSALVKELLDGRKPTEDDVRLMCEKYSRNFGTMMRFITTTPAGKQRPITASGMAKALSRRPWNASLKTVCWKMGKAFEFVSGKPDAFYGRLFAERKAIETARNEAGEFAAQAADKLDRVNIGKDTDAFAHYSAGRLPPAHIRARVYRVTAKIFLSHWHAVAYEVYYGKPAPEPYVIAHLGHADYVPVPGWPLAA